MTNVQKIFDQFPYSLIRFSKDAQIDYFNKSAAELFGFSSDMGTGELTRLFSEKAEVIFFKNLQLFIASESSEVREFSIHINELIFDATFFTVEAEVYTTFKLSKKTQDRLHNNLIGNKLQELSLRDTWDNATDLIWDWDLVTGKIWRNKKYNDSLNYKHNEDEHYDVWHKNLHEDDRQRVLDGIKHSLDTGASFWADVYRYYTNDGTIKTISDRGFISFDAAGKPTRMIGFKIDLSEYISLEKKMHKAELRYQDLFSKAKDGIVVFNEKGEILEANLTISEISEFSKEELQAKNVFDFFKIKITEDSPVNIDELRIEKQKFTTGRILTKSNGEKDLECSTSTLSDGNFMTIVRDITEKIQTLKELSNNERRYKTLTDTAPVGIFETNEVLQTTFVNETFLSFWGRSFEEVVGVQWITFVHPDDQMALLESWQVNSQLKVVVHSEFRIINRDGTIITVLGNAVPIFGDKGEFTGYIGTLTDITKEREALKKLQESEESNRMVIEEASDAIYTCDFNGILFSANQTAAEITGFSTKQLPGRSIFEFLNPKEVEQKPVEFESLKKGNKVENTRHLKTKSGGSFVLETTSKMISDGRILIVGRDITEKIKHQELVAKERDLSNSIINSLPGVFYIHNKYGHLLRWNTNLESISGYSSKEIETMNPRDFFKLSDRAKMYREAEKVFTNGWGDSEVIFITKDGTEIPFFISGYLLDYEGQPCIIAVCIDISEKRNKEKLLQQSYTEIRELASHLTRIRDEERKRISREIHDELGQKLTAIKMDVGWIFEKGGELNQVIKENLLNIISLLNDGNESVRRILTELRPAVLHERNLIEALKNQNVSFVESKKIPLDFTHNFNDVEIPEAMADCIFRVYQESLTNIMRYAEASRVACDVSIRDSKLTVTINDNGKGFSLKDTSVKKRFGILGMKERLYSQGGELDIQSTKGVGTTVSFSIPFSTKKNL